VGEGKKGVRDAGWGGQIRSSSEVQVYTVGFQKGLHSS